MSECQRCVELGKKPPRDAHYFNPDRCKKHRRYIHQVQCVVCHESFLKRGDRVGMICPSCRSNKVAETSPKPVREQETDKVVDRMVSTGREVTVINGVLINDVESLLKKIGFDPDSEVVYDKQIKSYQGFMRRIDKKVVKVQMFSIGVKIRPNNEKQILDGLKKDVLREIKRVSPIIKTPRVKYDTQAPHLLEVGTFELHLGKYANFLSTGADYNLDKAEQIFTWAFEELLMRSANEYKLSRILFPVGNDFIHFDNIKRTTTAGTEMNDAVGTYYEVKTRARRLIDWAITRALEVAPIDIVIVPGNHDTHAVYTLGEVLEAKYEGHKFVTVDNKPHPRRYYDYGVNLIGFTHGRDEKLADLPVIMPVECEEHKPGSWSHSIFREMHVGHYHHRRKTESLRDYKGIGVRLLPSLAALDLWHVTKGFIGSLRSAEGYIWHHDLGLTDTKFATLKRT